MDPKNIIAVIVAFAIILIILNIILGIVGVISASSAVGTVFILGISATIITAFVRRKKNKNPQILQKKII